MGEEEEVRVGPPPGDDQARPPEDPHPQDQGWQQEVQGTQWYESHYAQPLARKKGAKLTDAEEAVLNRKMSKKTARKYAELQKTSEVEKPLLDQFQTGRVLAAISSRPGQCGRSDGYILEGKELEFYLRKIKSKKGK